MKWSEDCCGNTLKSDSTAISLNLTLGKAILVNPHVNICYIYVHPGPYMGHRHFHTYIYFFWWHHCQTTHYWVASLSQEPLKKKKMGERVGCSVWLPPKKIGKKMQLHCAYFTYAPDSVDVSKGATDSGNISKKNYINRIPEWARVFEEITWTGIRCLLFIHIKWVKYLTKFGYF